MIKKKKPAKSAFPVRTRHNHPTKEYIMCYVLAQHGPLTRLELMKRVWFIGGAVTMRTDFHPTSNECYFLRKQEMYNTWTSPRARGLFQVQMRTKAGNVYAITDKGREYAKAYAQWCGIANENDVKSPAK